MMRGVLFALCFCFYGLALAEPQSQPSTKPNPTKQEKVEEEFQLRMSLASTAISSGKYSDAVSHLKKAQAIKPDPRIYFELGEAYRKWGDQSNKDEKRQIERWKLAKTNYRKYLKVGGKGPNAEKAKQAIEDLEQSLNP